MVQTGENLYLAKPITGFASQHARDIRTASYLGDNRSKPTPGGYDTQRRGHRRLPHSALTADNEEPLGK